MSYADLTSYGYQIQSLATQLAQQEAEGDTPNTQTRNDAIAARYTDIPSLFIQYSGFPDPQDYALPISNIHDLMAEICVDASAPNPIDKGDIYYSNTNGIGKVASDGTTIASWNGEAAANFKNNFLGLFRSRAQNQFVVAAILKAGLEAQRDMWAAGRSTIEGIAHSTLDALNNTRSCDANSWNVTFTVLSSVAAIAGLVVATDGVGAAVITASVIASASQTVAIFPPNSGQPEKKTYPGGTVDQIIGGMRDAISTFGTQLTDTTAKVTDCLQTNTDQVRQGKSNFVAPRPSMDDMSDSQLTSVDGLGHP